QYFVAGDLIYFQSFKVMLSAPSEIRVNLYYPDRTRSIEKVIAGVAGENLIELDQYFEAGFNYLINLSANNLIVIPSEAKQDDNIAGLFEINGSQGDSYHFIYDWQVESLCQSLPAQISPQTSVPSPSPIDTTRCGPESFRFFVASEGYTVNWFDWDHNLIHQGENFETPIIYGNTRYFVEREDPQVAQSFGPQLDESISYPWPQNGFSVIHFTVHEPIIFESFELYADSTTNVVAFLVEDIPSLQAAFNDSIPAGHQRVAVNWVLPAGQYSMRGNSAHIHVQDQGLHFPYQIEGLIQIDSISGPLYLPFFNWRVRAASCWSERVPITINRGLQIDPFADFSIRQNQNLVSFENLSKPYDRVLWDFGDGLRSTDIHPTHLFKEGGSYEVGLQIWFGGCSDYITQSININQVQSFLEIFPNPADDRVVFSIGALETESFSLEIYDMSGRQVWSEELGELSASRLHFHALEIGDWASGFYIVRLRSAKQAIVGKLQVN
ncbi:MAG: T9SS type A sorting domain-containing protein, partial [Bacteroidota bacterium]